MALSVSIGLVSSSARVTSVKSAKGGVTDGHPDTKIGPGIPGSDKNRGFKDNKCDNLTGQPVNFMSQHSRVSSSLSEFVFLLSCKTC